MVDERILAKVRQMVLPALELHGPRLGLSTTRAFPTRAGIREARQYCGQLSKQDNCQVAVSLLLANSAASLPVDYRLYLPPA